MYFKYILTDVHRDKLLTIYQKQIKNPSILKVFSSILTQVYENILKSSNQKDFKSAAEIIRSLRNLRHGTHLTGSQYDQIFLDNNINYPKSLTILAWLTIMAVSLNPREYFLNS